MLELSKEDGPDEEDAQHDGTLKMPKRALFDRLRSILTINVVTTSMVASVNVLPSWRAKRVLQIELTQPNLDLLLEEPTAGSAPWKPTLEHENVNWVASRNGVQCTWWDSKKQKQETQAYRREV